MDPRSPPLPFTARTRTGSSENGSGSSIFELVLPPPKLVMRKSAPSRFDRYLRSDSSLPVSFSATRSSQRSFNRTSVVVSDIGRFAVLLESLGFAIPSIGIAGLEHVGGERSIDDRAGLLERAHRAGGDHLHRDVAKRGRLGRTGQHAFA